MTALHKLAAFRVRTGSVAGIPIFLHGTLLAVAAYLLIEQLARPQLAVLLVGGLFGSVLLHELGHCWAARQVGGSADEVVLWPLGGLAAVRAPHRPWPQFFVALMGPLTNLGVAAVCLPLYLVAGGELAWLVPGRALGALGPAGSALFWLIEINGLLFLFNLVPAFPMDGGRLLQTALWPRLGERRALEVAVRAAFVSAALMVGYGIATVTPLVAVIGVLVGAASWQQLATLRAGGGAAQAHDLLWQATARPVDEPTRRPSAIVRWSEERRRRREDEARQRREDLRADVDAVLAKVSSGGLAALTPEERRFLEFASAELRKEQARHGTA